MGAYKVHTKLLREKNIGEHVDINDNGTMIRVPYGWVLNQWFVDNKTEHTIFTSVFIPDNETK